MQIWRYLVWRFISFYSQVNIFQLASAEFITREFITQAVGDRHES